MPATDGEDTRLPARLDRTRGQGRLRSRTDDGMTVN